MSIPQRQLAPPPHRPRLRQLPLPWAAKFSLLTWGSKAFRSVALQTHTPARCWQLPAWDNTQTWAELCRQAARSTA